MARAAKWPSAALLALLLALMLAGCAGPSKPPVPGDSMRQWDSASEPWLIRTTGCGFCGPAPGHAVHELTAYDQGGGVIAVRYARAETGFNGTVHASAANASLDAYLPALQRLFDSVSAYAVEDGADIVVHEVHVGRLAAADEANVDQFLETALRSAMPPGPPDFTGCADCAAVTLDAVSGDRQLSVVLNLAQGHERDAWRRIDDQMLTLARWVRGEMDDPRAGTGGPTPAATPEAALAEAWLMRSTGCGFCSGDPSHAEFSIVVVDYGGAIVRIDYARDDQFTVADGVQTDAAALESFFTRVEAYGADPSVRVHAVAYEAMIPAEFDRIRTDLEATLQQVRDPGSPDGSGCADCSSVNIEVHRAGEVEWRVRLLGNTEKGDPWLTVDRSLRALDAWLQDRT